jgi:hypothetical protein
MVTSGRFEFRDLVWPLITSDNTQISLSALRASRRFRPSVLGPNVAKDILSLPLEVRETIVSEIADRSGIDGLDLAVIIAKADPALELKAAAVGALSFRRADRHVADILSTANDDAFDFIYQKRYLEAICDEAVTARIAAARDRVNKNASEFDRLGDIVHARDGKDYGPEITSLIGTIKIEHAQNAEVVLIYEANKQANQAVADGLLERLRSGRELFFGADRILAASGIVVEDRALLDLLLSQQGHMDTRAEAAASILGPISVGKLIDELLAVVVEIGLQGKYEKNLNDRRYGLRDRIARVPGASLIAAIQERASTANNIDIREFSELLCRSNGDRARLFPQGSHAVVGQMAEQWSDRLISGGDDATRGQLSAVANLIGHFPSLPLLPILKRLLDEELRRYRAFRQQAEIDRWQGRAADEARTLYTHMYQQAFTAVKAAETTALMISYLPDEYFGETAALVLKVQWMLANEPKEDSRFLGTVDFSRVEEKRAERSSCSTLTCVEAEAIFNVIVPLIGDGATESEKKHAISLAIQAVRLPHGERDDVIKTLLSIAPHTSRAKLVLNLILSGRTIPFGVIEAGIKDVLVDAEKNTWILDEGGWQLKAWLLLLPFVDHPARIVDLIAALPVQQRTPHFLEEMIRATEVLHAPEIEEALFGLAENDGAFYANQAWRDAVLRRGSLTSARRYLDLVVGGKIEQRDGEYVSQEIAGLLTVHSELRDYVYGLFKEGSFSKAVLLAGAIAKSKDSEGLLLLVGLENSSRRRWIRWEGIRETVTQTVPSKHWQGAFEIVPVAATDLRRQLLAMTTNGGAHDAAARVLRTIDQIRDENGAPEDEPRHPDLASGKPWPILAA